MLPDLVVEEFRVSNPHAVPGSRARGRIVVKNIGAAELPASANNVQIFLEQLDGEVVTPLFDNELSLGLAPDETQELPLNLFVPRETLTLRVRFEYTGDEVSTENNSSTLVVGVLPPDNLRCTDQNDPGVEAVGLSWENHDAYDALLVYRDGHSIAVVPGSSTSHIDDAVEPGRHAYAVRGRIGLSVSDPEATICRIAVPPAPPLNPVEGQFIRGNANDDARVDLSDAVYVLGHLFLGQPAPPCVKAADANDDGRMDISDAVYVLSFLFLGADPIPAPYPECGVDPTADALTCEESSCSP